ncbi:MAG: phage tail protein I [Silanimonas sp.]|nr:MAG: phage tail protein I [Silanimonas sp.]
MSEPSLLPPNATPAERALEGATARLADVSTPLRDLWNPDTCPAALLPWLAWALAVPGWQPDWSETAKRRAIARSIAVHRRRGTFGAVRRVLDALGFEAEIVEWFQDGSPPYTYSIVADARGEPLLDWPAPRLSAAATAAANVRSHLRALIVGNHVQAPLHIGTFVECLLTTDVLPPPPEYPEVFIGIDLAAGVSYGIDYQIDP